MHVDEIRARLGAPRVKCDRCPSKVPVGLLRSGFSWMGSKKVKAEAGIQPDPEFIRVNKTGSICPVCVQELAKGGQHGQ